MEDKPALESVPYHTSEKTKKENAPERPDGRLTGPLILAVAAATCGSSFIFGYNLGVINAPEQVIQSWINTSYFALHHEYPSKSVAEQIWSWVVAIYPLTAMFGGLACGWAADKFGRKGAMMLNNIFTIVAAIIMGITKVTNCYPLLIVGRLIIGFNCGLNSGLAPMYLMEVAPANLSGMLGSVHQLMVTIAILVANLLGLPQVLGTATLWPFLLALNVVPSVWQIIALRFCPETPKYLLLIKNKQEEAVLALRRLRGTQDVSAEIALIQDEADQANQREAIRFIDMFKTPVLAWALTIALVMMAAQQFSGINVVMYYSTIIFREGAELSASAAGAATLGMSIVNVVMTIISTMIVDRLGRRLLMLLGMLGMWVCAMCLVISLHLLKVDEVKFHIAAYFAIIFVYAFVISFATGPGSIPWFYVSELFDQGARGYANALAVGMNWAVNFIVGYTYLGWTNTVHEFSFLLYVGFVTVFGLFIFAYAPETKGRRLNDILKELEKQVDKFRRLFGLAPRQQWTV